jgi:hypothetical protein
MWALVIAFGFVGGLVKVAYEQSVEPTLKPAWRRAKLVRLARIPDRRLKIDQAEDGIVLAREFEAPELEAKFRKAAAALKKKKRI